MHACDYLQKMGVQKASVGMLKRIVIFELTNKICSERSGIIVDFAGSSDM